jgi:hypothetical protein
VKKAILKQRLATLQRWGYSSIEILEEIKTWKKQ